MNKDSCVATESTIVRMAWAELLPFFIQIIHNILTLVSLFVILYLVIVFITVIEN